MGVEVLNSDSSAFLHAFDGLRFYIIPASMRSHSNSPFERYLPLMHTSRHTLACDRVKLLPLGDLRLWTSGLLRSRGIVFRNFETFLLHAVMASFGYKQGLISFICFFASVLLLLPDQLYTTYGVVVCVVMGLLRSVEHLFDFGLECRLITTSEVSRESCCKWSVHVITGSVRAPNHLTSFP